MMDIEEDRGKTATGELGEVSGLGIRVNTVEPNIMDSPTRLISCVIRWPRYTYSRSAWEHRTTLPIVENAMLRVEMIRLDARVRMPS